MARAIGLLSGGLDSMLAVRVLLDQKVDILGVAFVTPFFGSARAESAARLLGVPIRAVDITAVHFEVVKNPPHGWGRNMNPCIDCHALMLREAGALMAPGGFDLLFTGEVLGQRPMSQNRGSLNLIARESGFADLLLRPLSAKSLQATVPEIRGWVDRERLLNLSGRGRKGQLALAREYGITRYPAPAGGCLLTDPRYAARIKELLRHVREASRTDLDLLAYGRHFRLPGGAKLVVGRTQRDNEAIQALRSPEHFLLQVDHYPGPLVLGWEGVAEENLSAAAGLAAAYSDAPEGVPVTVSARDGGIRTTF